MGLFSSKNFDSLETLFIDHLQDLYDAEQRITKALPRMADAAHHPDLKAGFRQHLRETQDQLGRLERVFQIMGRKAEGKTCYAMKGLIEEGQEVIDASGDVDVKDAALIAAVNVFLTHLTGGECDEQEIQVPVCALPCPWACRVLHPGRAGG